MDQRGTFFALLSIFLIVQIIGLYCGYQYLQMIKTGEVEGAFQNPESVSNSLLLFVYILLMTGVLILVIRFRKSLLRIFEAMAVFFSSWIAFDFLIPYWLIGENIPWGLVLALALTAWKMLRPTILSQNVALIFALSGAGAIIGGSLGVLPIIVFLLILSIYDFISVFWTKHMVYLAKAITERPMAFTAAVPLKTKKVSHVFQLGGGDLVMPLVLSVSVLGRLGLYQAALTTLGSLIALGILFAYVLKHPGEPLPALPPVSAGACLGLVAGIILFGV
jgi:presenilin-like A22 family membrane protease